MIILSGFLQAKKKSYYIDRDTAIASKILWQITASVGLINSSGNNDFYEDYARLMNPTSEVVQSYLSYGIGFRIIPANQFRLHFLGGYFQSKMSDRYFEPFSENATTGRNLNQTITIDDIPICVRLDYLPFIRSQFRSYVGLGFGINLSSVEWNENVNSDVSFDPRESGARYSENFVSPLARLILGTELNFDKYGKKKLLGSLFFEANISYIFRSIDLFSGFNEFEQFLLVENFNYLEEYNLNNLSLNLGVGLSFNFYKVK